MGDTILFITIIEPKLPGSNFKFDDKSENETSTLNGAKMKQMQKRIGADSSLREAMDIMCSLISEKVNIDNKCMKDVNEEGKWSFIDCSYHPPKTVEITASNNDYTGPNSITLQKLGWFPSAKIIIVEKNSIAEKDILSCKNEVMRWCDYGEQHMIETSTQSNNTNMPAAAAQIMIKDNQTGMLKPTSKLNPSELLHQVTTRFDSDGDDITKEHQDTKDTSDVRRTEEERCLKMDKAIEKLNSKNKKGNKNKKVNDKVRQMLIKSRAKPGDTTSKKLRQEDRIYLEVLIVHINSDDNYNSNNDALGYYYFSKMVSIGKIATSFLKAAKANVEFVVNMSSDGNGVSTGNNRYYTLPNIMRLYEAKQKKYVNDFDRVIVRVYQNEIDSCPSIKEYEG